MENDDTSTDYLLNINKLERKWDLIPHSKASNSYQLLEDVIIAIEEEPLRIEMTNFQHYSLPDTNPFVTKGPACGMVGCIGGQIFSLTATESEFYRTPTNIRIEEIAFSKLPPNCSFDAKKLFWGEYLPEEYHDGGDVEYPFPKRTLYGTQEYVNQVVANIRKFMEKWETELKAFPLTSIPID